MLTSRQLLAGTDRLQTRDGQSRVPTAQRKQGKWGRGGDLCQGKHKKFGEKKSKTNGLFFAQVVNSMFLKMQILAIFIMKFSAMNYRYILPIISKYVTEQRLPFSIANS